MLNDISQFDHCELGKYHRNISILQDICDRENCGHYDRNIASSYLKNMSIRQIDSKCAINDDSVMKQI